MVGESLWTQCPDCEDFFCRFHWEHAADCKCPGVEKLLAKGIDPYLPGSLSKFAQTKKRKKKNEP